MLNAYFIRPLELKMGEQNYKFCSVLDFEFALRGRTSVPSNKIIELLRRPREHLRVEAHAIKALETQLFEIMSRSIDSPKTIKRAMQELDLKVFSQDHNWRSIFIALQEVDGEAGDTLLRAALYKYSQYLTSRYEIIKTFYAQYPEEEPRAAAAP